MNRVIVAFRSVGVSFAIASLALFTFAGPATAVAPQRTFVRSDGVDAGNLTCSLATPCRTFTAAIGVVNAGGEVVILDTAGYGPFTINKSVKVIGPSGVYGGISVQGGGGATTGIVINAGDTDTITLRGLDVSGVPGAPPLPLIGIDIQKAGAVHIEKSSIGNFTQGRIRRLHIRQLAETDRGIRQRQPPPRMLRRRLGRRHRSRRRVAHQPRRRQHANPGRPQHRDARGNGCLCPHRRGRRQHSQ
jgi:hypothetical protein